MAENYYAILYAVKTALETIPEMTGRVILRKKPTWEGLLDQVPFTIVAPPADLSEEIAALQFEDNAHIDYPVYVIHVAAASWSLDALRWRLARREDARLLLYEPLIFEEDVEDVFDVDYNPAPALPLPAPDNLDVTAQLFTVRTSEARSASS